MQHVSLHTGPPDLSSSPRLHPAGQRSGEGVNSMLPALYEDARGRPEPTPAPHGQLDSSGTGDREGQQDRTEPRRIGKYLVSPLIKTLGEGWLAASVSIRSGSGQSTSDRILRPTRLFRCATDAAEFAHSEALRWIGAGPSPAVA